MKLAAILNRLQSQSGSFFEVIRPAESLNTVDPALLPAAYVHPLEETSERSLTMNITSQRRTVQMVVMVATGHPFFDADQGTWSEPLETARGNVLTPLIGFSVIERSEPIEHIKGELVDVTADYILWRDVFAVVDFLRSI